MRASIGGHGSYLGKLARRSVQPLTQSPGEEEIISEFPRGRDAVLLRHRYHKTKEGVICMDRRILTAAVA